MKSNTLFAKEIDAKDDKKKTEIEALKAKSDQYMPAFTQKITDFVLKIEKLNKDYVELLSQKDAKAPSQNDSMHAFAVYFSEFAEDAERASLLYKLFVLDTKKFLREIEPLVMSYATLVLDDCYDNYNADNKNTYIRDKFIAFRKAVSSIIDVLSLNNYPAVPQEKQQAIFTNFISVVNALKFFCEERLNEKITEIMTPSPVKSSNCRIM